MVSWDSIAHKHGRGLWKLVQSQGEGGGPGLFLSPVWQRGPRPKADVQSAGLATPPGQARYVRVGAGRDEGAPEN